jgi:hypothetical protein
MGWSSFRSCLGAPSCGGLLTDAFTVFTVVGCFAVVGWLIWVLAHGSGEDDRRAEEAAREYYDRHGRWPDD